MALWYEVTGSGPDLVLLHGWSQNAGVWHSLVPALQDKYRITLIELPGHGASPLVDQALQIDAWVDAVLQVAPQRAAWLGWSLGGLIAQRAAALAPERVECLCLAVTAPKFIKSADWSHGVDEADFKQFAEVLYANPEATIKRFFALQVQGGANQKAALNQLIAALAERPPADLAGLQAGLHLLLHTDVRAALKQLDMPCAWLWGAKDTIASAAMANDVAQLMPDATCTVLDRAAHAPFISHFADSMSWLAQALAR